MRSNMNCVYKIVNTFNKNVYIGSTKYLARRKGEHMKKLRDRMHSNKELQRLFDLDNTCLSFICIEKDIEENLKNREQYYIDLINPSLNICKKADSSLGYKHSEKTKQHLSKKFKGMKRSLGRVLGEESKRKQALAKNKAILQYDNDMNFIKEWESAKDAAIKLWGNQRRRSGIRDSIRGRTPKAFGFIWKEKGFELERIRNSEK